MRKALIIPARYDSSRLPGKPLIDIAGETMIYRTWAQCAQAFPKENIYVATDDERIARHCEENYINVLMTSKNCLTGTDRVLEASKQVNADLYINVQGDEPILNPDDLAEMVKAADSYPGEILNGYTKITTEAHFRSSSIPKVVMRPDGRLLYMSRAPIPTDKSNSYKIAWRQVCIYVFPKGALLAFGKKNKKTKLEAIEDIEILRFLEMGFDVRMIPLSPQSVAVDNPEDVEKVERIIYTKGL